MLDKIDVFCFIFDVIYDPENLKILRNKTVLREAAKKVLFFSGQSTKDFSPLSPLGLVVKRMATKKRKSAWLRVVCACMNRNLLWSGYRAKKYTVRHSNTVFSLVRLILYTSYGDHIYLLNKQHTH